MTKQQHGHMPAAIALGLGPGGLPVAHSHYVPAFAPSHPSDRELQRAICGRYILPANGHRGDPSCSDCVALLADEQAAS